MSFWSGRNVLITGHAGFKGAWLALYLWDRGARVYGYGRARTAGESFYALARVREKLAGEWRADVTDGPGLCAALDAAQPTVVFHLAARAIVRDALHDPLGTVQANVMGSAHLLDAVRRMPRPPAVVMVTTDKVYRNAGAAQRFRETDPLGGLDPYGASKAAVELIADSYRHTYGLTLATARCANVIGGGDWGPHRLVPNCIRAFGLGEAVVGHEAVRVWMHVLDSVRGYAMLGERLCGEPAFGRAWNFGPDRTHTVREVAESVASHWGGARVELSGVAPSLESRHLDIDSRQAYERLGWWPVWGLDRTLRETVAWHRAHGDGGDMELVSLEQLRAHERDVGRSDRRTA